MMLLHEAFLDSSSEQPSCLLTNLLLGASVIDDGSAASSAAFIHIPEKRSSDKPVSYNETESCCIVDVAL